MRLIRFICLVVYLDFSYQKVYELSCPEFNNNLFLKLILSQEDITTILRTLNENIGESSGSSTSLPEPKDTTSHCSDMHSTSQHSAGNVF